MNRIDELKSFLDSNQEEYIDLLRKMVRAKSTAGNEEEVQLLISDRLKAKGFHVDIWELDYNTLSQNDSFCASRPDFVGSPNVVGTLKGTGGGRSIILNGHVDVVPEGDLEQWKYDPYSGEVADGKLFGRGATDMKGGNLATLLAVEALQSTGINLKGDIIYESVVEEESGGAGTLAALERGYKADAALIPEPTGMRIFPKQQGSMWFRIHISGMSAHGGTRYEGVSAIEKAFIVHEELLKLEKTRNEQLKKDPLYQNNPIPIPINIGKINGGNWPSSVADEVVLEGRLGIAPGETPEEASRVLEQHLGQLGNFDEWFSNNPVMIEWFGAKWLPGEIKEDHPFLLLLLQAYQQVTNKAPIIEASPWGTDGGLLSQLGDIPVVVFGPGTTNMAHFPNEYIELKNIFEAALIIAQVLMDWCGVEELTVKGENKSEY